MSKPGKGVSSDGMGVRIVRIISSPDDASILYCSGEWLVTSKCEKCGLGGLNAKKAPSALRTGIGELDTH